MKKHYIFLCVFLFVNISMQSQEVMKLILSEKYGYDYFQKTLYDERVSRYDQSKKHFFTALKLYDSNAFRAAITEFERAIQLCTQAVYYYHYGVCLMDMRDYRNAERAFIKALQFFDSWNPFYEAFYGGENPLYTFDQNGAPREKYSAYYNLACVHSNMYNVNTAFNYLRQALEYGYPYIDYIYRDPYLKNMLNNIKDVSNQIQTIYNAGFVNEIAGKSFENSRAGDLDEYFFIDGRNMFVRSSKNLDNVRNGTYEIKNYQIIIHYNTEQEIINIKDMSKLWRESSYNPNP